MKKFSRILFALSVTLASFTLALNNADLVPSLAEAGATAAATASEQQLQSQLEALGVVV